MYFSSNSLLRLDKKIVSRKREKEVTRLTFAYIGNLNFQRVFKLLKSLGFFIHKSIKLFKSLGFFIHYCCHRHYYRHRHRSYHLRCSLSTVFYFFFAFFFLFVHFARLTLARIERKTSVQSTEMKCRGRGSSGIYASVRLYLVSRKADATRSVSTSSISTYRCIRLS